MAIIVGGLRQRLIWDSMYDMVRTALTDLGWFDTGRQHLPFHFAPEPVDADVEVPFNTLGLSDEDRTSADIELGSNFAEHRTGWWLDFYAESDAMGRHVAYDLEAILAGRMPEIGRSAAILVVRDTREVAAPELFTCEIEDVSVDRAHEWPEAWRKHWWAVSFTLVDEHGSSAEAGP